MSGLQPLPCKYVVAPTELFVPTGVAASKETSDVVPKVMLTILLTVPVHMPPPPQSASALSTSPSPSSSIPLLQISVAGGEATVIPIIEYGDTSFENLD